jgi:hypothetical protein
MSQNDLVISNQTFPATRADITSALQALGSTNSGPSAPSTTYANMMWYDTTSNILKIRAEANDAWISIGYLHQGENQFHILDDTYVADASGVHTGLLGDQTTATWQAGTGTTESLVSPAKVLAAIEANVEGITHTSGSAPYYGVRAWNGQGQTGNCTISGSIVTFTTAMPHANYAVTCNATGSYGNAYAQSKTVNGFQFIAVSSGGNPYASMGEFIVVC